MYYVLLVRPGSSTRKKLPDRLLADFLGTASVNSGWSIIRNFFGSNSFANATKATSRFVKTSLAQL